MVCHPVIAEWGFSFGKIFPHPPFEKGGWERWWERDIDVVPTETEQQIDGYRRK